MDMVHPPVLAHTICAALRRRLPDHQPATFDTLQRRFLSTGGTTYTNGDQVTVRLDRRTGAPLRRSPRHRHPLWRGRTLYLDYA
jgi:hypothetical protein